MWSLRAAGGDSAGAVVHTSEVQPHAVSVSRPVASPRWSRALGCGCAATWASLVGDAPAGLPERILARLAASSLDGARDERAEPNQQPALHERPAVDEQAEPQWPGIEP
jgi:hypothetical protein